MREKSLVKQGILLLTLGLLAGSCNSLNDAGSLDEDSPADPYTPDNPHTLTATAVPEEAGKIAFSDSGHAEGEFARIHAEPVEGYVFAGWDGDHSGSVNPDSLQMDQDKHVVAVFKETGKEEKGSEDGPSDSEEKGSDHSDSGDKTPEEDEDKDSNKEDKSSSDEDNSNTEDDQEPEPETFTITVEEQTSGEVILTPARGIYEAGEEVTAEYIPDEEKEMEHWLGDLTDFMSENPVTFTIEQDMEIDAYVTTKLYQATIEPSTGGALILQPTAKYGGYARGQEIQIIASPDVGYKFVEWSDDLSAHSSDDDRITVDFEPDQVYGGIFAAEEEEDEEIADRDLNSENEEGESEEDEGVEAPFTKATP